MNQLCAVIPLATPHGCNRCAAQMKDLLLEFFRVTRGRRPEHLIFFRDGVSEGQFKEVYYVSAGGLARGMGGPQRMLPCCAMSCRCAGRPADERARAAAAHAERVQRRARGVQGDGRPRLGV